MMQYDDDVEESKVTENKQAKPVPQLQKPKEEKKRPEETKQ